MKKIIFLFLFVCSSTHLFSQDIIITKDDQIIKAKIVQVYDAVIKYSLFEEPDSETFLILKSKIISLTYEDGQVVSFEEFNKNSAQAKVDGKNIPGIAANQEKIRKNVIKVNLFSTGLAVIKGGFELDIQYSRYLTPNFAIPIQVEIFGASGAGVGFSVLTGLEVIPFTHRQKSGLLIDALVGVITFDQLVGFVAHGDIGYQVVSSGGFVFSSAIGPWYDTFTNKIGLHFILSLGFAF
jgi:hypothetical protein